MAPDPTPPYDASDTALLLIDVINDFEFEDADQMFERTMEAARRIRDLADRARQAGLPIVYVNDNFGYWHESFDEIVTRCSREGARGKPLVDLLRPTEKDYFVLKPQYSGFFETSLSLLLNRLDVSRLILVGFSGNICILFTAGDAYMRGFDLTVPSDCTASLDPSKNNHAMALLRNVLDADTPSSGDMRFS